MKEIKLDESKDRQEVGFDAGTCPYCGDTNIYYDVLEVEDDNAFYECQCNTCGNFYREYYKLEFDGQWGFPIKKKSKKKAKK